MNVFEKIGALRKDSLSQFVIFTRENTQFYELHMYPRYVIITRIIKRNSTSALKISRPKKHCFITKILDSYLGKPNMFDIA